MKIGFFLSSFPVFSETFVSNEIIQLQKHLDGVIWFETNNKTSKTQPHVKKIKFNQHQAPQAVLSKENFSNILKSHLYWGINFPLRYLEFITTFLSNASIKNFKLFLKSAVVAQQVIEEKCDLIYVHETDRAFFYALFTSKLTKIPFGIIFHTYYLFYKSKFLAKKMRAANFTIFQSNYSQNYVKKKLKLNSLKNSFVISSPGIDTNYFSPQKLNNKKSEKLKIISVGRLEEMKGYRYLINAVNELKNDFPDISLKIIGYGSLKNDLEKLVKKLKLQKNIFFLGAIGHNNRFIKLIRESSIFVLPSIIDSNGVRDMHPNAVKEAMSSGLIIIASDLGGMKEFVKSGKNGFLTQPNSVDDLKKIIIKITKLKKLEKLKIKESARKTILSIYEKGEVTKKIIKVFSKYKVNKNNKQVNWKKYTAILIIFFSYLIRFFFIKKNDLWLDEKYSIYFANRFSFEELLFNFKEDVHPGLSYILVKIILSFSESAVVLRNIISSLPQLISASLIFNYRKILSISTKASLLIIFFIGFNPFLSNLSWQIRMYGLVFLGITILHIQYQKIKKAPNYKNLFLFWIYISLINMTQYSTMFFTFPISVLGTLEFFKKTKISLFLKTKEVSISIAVAAIYISQFFIFGGVNFKEKFNHISWISTPTIKNIPHLFFTILGFNSDLNNQKPVSFLEIVFFIILISLMFLFLKKNKNLIKKNTKNTKKELRFFVLIPIVTIILISIVVPFLSQRIFFYNFIPKASLFLPRIFLPGILGLLLYLPKKFKKNNFEKLFSIFIILSIPFWIKTNSIVNTNKFQLLFNEDQNIISSTNNKALLTFPSWYALEKINKNNLTIMQDIGNSFEKSAIIEREIIPKKQLNVSEYCSDFSNQKILIIKSRFDKYQQPNNSLNKVIESCCKQQEKNNKSEIWVCN